MAKTTYQTGLFGEGLARKYLQLKCYRVLNTRFKSHVGEIDLIAKKSGCICFVEVKRHINAVAAAEAISHKQKQRISRAALIWQQENPRFINFDLSFDAVLITGRGLGFRIQHLRNAWSLDEIGLV